MLSYIRKLADVMELADVTDSKSVGSDTVWVRVPPSAPKRKALNLNGFRAFPLCINGLLIALTCKILLLTSRILPVCVPKMQTKMQTDNQQVCISLTFSKLPCRSKLSGVFHRLPLPIQAVRT